MKPEIKISYNQFLDPIFIFYCQNHPDLKKMGWNDWTPPTKEAMDVRVKNYREAWRQIEERVLKSLQENLKLNFKRNVIDVHIVSGNPRQFSRPLVIKSGYSKVDFIITIIHELIHVLLSDNEHALPHPKDIFPKHHKESQTTKNHIVVHAVLKIIFLETLNSKELLDRNIEISTKHSTKDYLRAWEIVNDNGANQIISEFISSYKVDNI